MTTKDVVIERFLDKAAAYATEHKWPNHEEIAGFRKKIPTALLMDELEAKCGPPYDNGHLADYVTKEFLSHKAGAIVSGAKPESAIARWDPTPEDKAFALDILTKIIKVIRA